MHRAVTNFVLPGLAVATIVMVSMFPSPQALDTAIQSVTSPFLTEQGKSLSEDHDARFIIEDHARLVPGLTSEIEANADCFVGLDAATADRLAECAPVVTTIIAQIVKHQGNPSVAAALSREETALLPQLKIAATEICRSLWSTGKHSQAFLDDPACQMAQVSLAPDFPMR